MQNLAAQTNPVLQTASLAVSAGGAARRRRRRRTGLLAAGLAGVLKMTGALKSFGAGIALGGTASI